MGKRILSIFFACIEALATVAGVVVIAFSDVSYSYNIRPAKLAYHGQTSFDHAIVDKDGNEYPAGTVFDVKYLYKDGRMEITYDSNPIYTDEYSHEFFVSEAINTDELCEALVQLLIKEEENIVADSVLPIIICFTVFIALFAFFIYVNNRIEKISGRIIALIVFSANGIIFSTLLVKLTL